MKFANEFIPGITGLHLMEAMYASSCAFTVTRDICDEPNTFAFSVSDWTREMHKVRVVLLKPRMEEWSDLDCKCTCPSFAVLDRDWRVVCEHIMTSLAEMVDSEAEGCFSTNDWKRVRITIPSDSTVTTPATTSSTDDKEEDTLAKALREANPVEIMKTLQAMACEPENVPFLSRLLSANNKD
ncbi:hypothetical protein BASA81_001851 [Batrachochytrium salamandrivorans]|nr:hypothetical protein BASA81_001851 [Batrachochytrium salamandrivorans]